MLELSLVESEVKLILIIMWYTLHSSSALFYLPILSKQIYHHYLIILKLMTIRQQGVKIKYV